MGQRTLLPDVSEVVLDRLRVQGRERILMVLRPAGEQSRCPSCRGQSDRIHSWYRRRLSDLPWEGIAVGIELRVRRFFCDAADCPRRIFTEPMGKTAPRYARRTARLSDALGHHHRLLNEVARAVIPAEQPHEEPPKAELSALSVSRPQRLQRNNRQRRLDRYEAVMENARLGLWQREIARQCGLSRKTLRRWLTADGFPERKRSCRHSSVERHREYLEQRWAQGCHNAAQLWRELQSRGFRGRPHTLRDWLQKQYGRRHERQQQQTLKPADPRTSPRKVAWQILKQPEAALPFLGELFRRSPEIATLAATAREFFRMIRERDIAAWPEWQQAAAAGPLAGFAKHLCRDQTAFLAALEQPWSNGSVEGHVHRLKLIKRSMYVRASFDLLRLRVLHSA